MLNSFKLDLKMSSFLLKKKKKDFNSFFHNEFCVNECKLY